MAYVSFFVIAAIAVGSALGLILRPNAIHGALFLVVNLGSVAALYLMLGAEFLAAAQVIVYAGAIMVLFVFAIMVLRERIRPTPRRAAARAAGRRPPLAAAGVRRHGPLDWPQRSGRTERQRRRGWAAALHELPVPVRAHLSAAAGGDGRRAAPREAPRVTGRAGSRVVERRGA